MRTRRQRPPPPPPLHPIDYPTVHPHDEAVRAKTQLYLAIWRFKKELDLVHFEHLRLDEAERAELRETWRLLISSVRDAVQPEMKKGRS